MDDDDAQLQMVLELSRKEAEAEERRRLANFKADKMEVEGKEILVSSLHEINFQPALVGEHLHKEYKNLFNSKQYSDIILVVGQEKIYAHKVVLCAWSQTFKVMLENSTWKESQQQELKVQVEEKEHEVFKTLLVYMYSGEVKVVTEDVIPLLSLSNYYAVDPLKEACGELLATQLSGDSVFYLLDICEKFSCSNLRKLCAEYLAENFGELLKSDKLMELDADTWAEMLKSDEIQVNAEEDIFKALMRYANKYKEKRDEILEKVLPSVRFPLLSPKFLVEVVESDESIKHISCLHQLLHETYRFKAYPASVISVRTKPRKGNVWWDIEAVPPGMKVTDDNKTATVSSHQSAQLRTIRVIPSFNEGSQYREFKVNSISNSGFWIGVGVDKSISTVNTYPGQNGQSWGYEASGGQLYHNGAISSLQNGHYTSGDRIGILCDVYQKKLEFYKNGQLITSVSTFNYKPDSDSKLYPYVAFYSPGDSATIQAVSAPI